MEEKNESESVFDFGYCRHSLREKHEETIKQHKEYRKNHKHDENPSNEVKKYMNEFKEDIKYHKMRVECIEKYNEEKKVPKIKVPDKYFSKYDPNKDKPSEEELYPNGKEISLYENGYFVVHQIDNTCYLMAPILALIDQGKGNYIKEKMVREYEEDPTKAIVRLRDEDGLPVDIIVDKTRFSYDNRPLWLIMLEKAVCVMMNTNKFGLAKGDRLFGAHAEIVKGVNWYEIEEKQKNEEEVFQPKCFNMNDIVDSGEAMGFKLLFGKKVVDKTAFFLRFPNLKSKSFNANEKNDNMTFLKYFLPRKKLVIGSAIGLDFSGIQKTHVMYFKKYDENYVYGFESMGGPFKIPIANFNKMSGIYAAEFPGDKAKSKKIEVEENAENEENDKAKTKTENIIDTYHETKNNNDSNDLNSADNKTSNTSKSIEPKMENGEKLNDGKSNVVINSDNVNIVEQKDNNFGFATMDNNVGKKEKNKDKQFISWKFIALGILFFIGSALAFYCDTYLFISIGLLIIGLFLICWGIKNKLKTCIAYKFFDFLSLKQNKIGDTIGKNRDRTEDNNLNLEDNNLNLEKDTESQSQIFFTYKKE